MKKKKKCHDFHYSTDRWLVCLKFWCYKIHSTHSKCKKCRSCVP